MNLEQKINYQLNKYPGIKRVVKSIYQHTMYVFSSKIKSEGNITRISPDDASHEYFFGYYDKSPWDITDRYMLCMKANNTWSYVCPKEKADILLIDTALPETHKKRVKKIAETSSWNVQQGCMLQWLGSDFSSHFLFNDYRNGKYVSVIKEVNSGIERVIDAPVYTVSADGKTALTLDFSRLYNLRPGYGYYNVPEKTAGIALPDAPAVWKIDLVSGDVQPLLTYKDFATFQPRLEMQEPGAVHKINHLMLSPSGQKFMVLYRWFIGERKYTRIITCNVDGTDMYVLSDDDMVSHCFWKDDEHILAFENKKDGGTGYYYMTDKTHDYIHCWPQLSNDGHPSYSPDRSLIVTDTYPDRARIAEIKLMDGTDERKNEVRVIARVFAPFKYDNDTRCDLHPRWNHAGNKICFDSIFENHRGLYITDVPVTTKDVNITAKISVVIPVYNVEKYLERCVESVVRQTYTNLEIILVNDGSTDNSLNICRKLQEKYPQIIIVDKENGGQSSARNVGIAKATGKYITFVDSDDWIAPDTYEYSLKLLREADADVVQFNYFMVDKPRNIRQPKEKIEIFHGKDILQYYMTTTTTTTGSYSVCRCLFLTKKIKALRFREGKINEDIDFKYLALYQSRTLVTTNQYKYFYFQGENSTTTGGLRRRDLDLYDAAKELSILTEKEQYGTIKKLGRVKVARTPFSLLSKIAYYGIVDRDLGTDDFIRGLVHEHRNNLGILLTSPIPVSRKVLSVMYAINFDMSRKLIFFLRQRGLL